MTDVATVEQIERAKDEVIKRYQTELIDARRRLSELAVLLSDEIRLREKLGGILERTATALKGPPPRNTSWSWHDLPEVAAEARKLAQESLDVCTPGLPPDDVCKTCGLPVGSPETHSHGPIPTDEQVSEVRKAIYVGPVPADNPVATAWRERCILLMNRLDQHAPMEDDDLPF